VTVDDFLAYVCFLLLFGLVAVGVLFGLDALGLLRSQLVGGFVGMFLGVLCLIGAAIAMGEL
jgi:hypothetical protein